jgi:hypothetical protein
MLQTLEFIVSPTIARSITGQVNLIDVKRATGTLTFTMVNGGTIKATAGDTLRFDTPVNGFSVSSSAVGDDVELRYGLGFSFSLTAIINYLAQIYATITGFLAPSDTVVTAQSSAAAVTAADVSLNVATGTSIKEVTAFLDPLAPGPVRVTNGAAIASAVDGIWLMPGESFTFYTTARSVVGFRALSWYNPNPIAVNFMSLTVIA